jgi:hypothetical protein
MDRIPTNDNIELHKQVHEMMCMVLKSMSDRLSRVKEINREAGFGSAEINRAEIAEINRGAGFGSAEIKHQSQLLPEVSGVNQEEDEVSEAVSEYLK